MTIRNDSTLGNTWEPGKINLKSGKIRTTFMKTFGIFMPVLAPFPEALMQSPSNSFVLEMPTALPSQVRHNNFETLSGGKK